MISNTNVAFHDYVYYWLLNRIWLAHYGVLMTYGDMHLGQD